MNYLIFDKYLENKNITPKELFVKALNGEIALYIYVSQMQGFVPDKERFIKEITVTGLCKLNEHYHKRAICNPDYEIAFNSPLEIVELDSIFPRDLSKSSFIFNPIVYRREDLPINLGYKLKPFTKDSKKDIIYCYVTPFSNILVEDTKINEEQNNG